MGAAHILARRDERHPRDELLDVELDDVVRTDDHFLAHDPLGLCVARWCDGRAVRAASKQRTEERDGDREERTVRAASKQRTEERDGDREERTARTEGRGERE